MPGSYRAQVGDTFEVLAEALAPYVDQRMAAYLPDGDWILTAADKLGKRRGIVVSVSDPQFQLEVMSRFWGPVFADELERHARDIIGELQTARNHWAHISEGVPIDVDFALSVNKLAEELLGEIAAPEANRIDELTQELRWASVRDVSREWGVSEHEALMLQLTELQADRADLVDQLDVARQEAETESGRNRAVARQLAELQTQYAAVAGLRARYQDLERQLEDARTLHPADGEEALDLRAQLAEAQAAVLGLQEESGLLHEGLADARSALFNVDPADTATGQRWMWLVASLLVIMAMLMALVTGIGRPL